MDIKKKIFLKKESIQLYLVLLFFLLSGVWYSHAADKGAIAIGEAATLADLEQDAQKAEGQMLQAEDLLDKININSADAQELMRLDGIGEKRAADIIAYREEKGMFRSIEEMMQVSGIGEKTFEKIKDKITIG